MNTPNRRHNLRVVAELPAVIHAVHRDGAFGPPLSAQVLDLSASGARLVLTTLVLPGSTVCLRVGEGDDELTVTATAAVVRVGDPEPGSVTVGLRYTELDPRERVALSRAVLRLARLLGQGADQAF